MKKSGILFLILLIAGTLFFYFTLKSGKSGEDATDTVSPIPTDMQDNNTPDNWKTYIHESLGYSISYPDAYSVESNGDYSILILKTDKQPGFGPANFIYVSVVPPDQSTNEGEIYNFNHVQYNKLQKLGIGEKVALADTNQPDLNAWFTYTRVDDSEIDGHPAERFENTKPWEFPPGTTEVRFIFESDGYIYLMGYYYGGESLQDPLDPREAFRIISSFKLN